MKPSDHKTAHRNKAGHSFMAGVGYIAHATPPAIPAGIKPLGPVRPAAKAKEGSLHRLKNAGGGKTEMKWENGHWVHPHAPLTRGNRLAHTPEHLGKAGWSYIKAI